MAKGSGLGDQLFIGGYDVGGDINSIGSLSTPRGTLPATGITKSAQERMFGTRDGNLEATTYFNDADDAVHEALSGLPTADVAVMYCRGEAVGNEAFCLVGKQIDYAGNRGDDGSFLFNTNAQANAYGADWCLQLTAGKDTHASATNGSTLDTLASADFGWQAYLQVFSVGSGTVEITLQDSANGTDWTDLTGGAFTNATDRTSERLQSSSDTATVRRYVRVITEGTFTDAVIAVAINKNAALRAI
jgi:hypothetical protein